MPRTDGNRRLWPPPTTAGGERRATATRNPDLLASQPPRPSQPWGLDQRFGLLWRGAGQFLLAVLAQTLNRGPGIRLLLRRQQQPEHHNYHATTGTYGIRHRLVGPQRRSFNRERLASVF